MRSVIAALLILSLLAGMASCSGETSDKTDDTGTKKVTSNETESETRLQPDVPDRDFEQYGFTFVTIGPGMNVHWALPEIFVEELNGDIINDTIYERNSRISEKYNITIDAFFTPDPTAAAMKAVMADSDEYDVISTSYAVNALMQKGMLLDLYKVPYIDLKKPWWDNNASDQLEVAGRLYISISDLGYRDKEATYVFMFNKDMITDFGLEDPYGLVRNKEWTFEKMYDMARKVSDDINGDSKMDQNDRFGLLSAHHTALSMAASGGFRIATKNSEGLPELTFMSERNEMMLTKALEIILDTDNVLRANDYKDAADIWDEQLKTMDDNRGLFLHTLMNRVLLLRVYECNFGILPQPMMYEGQNEYLSPVDLNCTSSVAIPITASDPERTGIILEALTADSHYSLIPNYYEVAIKGKGLRDVESLEMFDIIFGNRVFDIGWAYNFGGLEEMVRTMGITGQTNVASQYQKREKAAQKAIEKFIETMTSIEQ
jgi:ABC-type glycerol-3-phosphate transport system substrate-binding protein